MPGWVLTARPTESALGNQQCLSEIGIQPLFFTLGGAGKQFENHWDHLRLRI